MKTIKISFKNFSLNIGQKKILDNINLNIYQNKATSIFGPSGGGKTTLLKSINRLIDFAKDARIEGEIYFEDKNIFFIKEINSLRKKIGFVSQKPQVLNSSVLDNIILGLKLNSKQISTDEAFRRAEEVCSLIGFWDDIKSRLQEHASSLSMGEKQKVCIARALTLNPEVLLLDEPTSDLDLASSNSIEEMILKLKNSLTILIATHDLNQVSRISDYSIFLKEGKVIEYGKTLKMFSNPSNIETEKFIRGKY
jgi:phosphate transport system ATP-binding protein